MVKNFEFLGKDLELSEQLKAVSLIISKQCERLDKTVLGLHHVTLIVALLFLAIAACKQKGPRLSPRKVRHDILSECFLFRLLNRRISQENDEVELYRRTYPLLYELICLRLPEETPFCQTISEIRGKN